MAAVTICSDFGAEKNKVSYCFHCFPIYFPCMYVYLLPVFLFSRLIMQLLWTCVFGCVISHSGQETVKDFTQWDWDWVYGDSPGRLTLDVAATVVLFWYKILGTSLKRRYWGPEDLGPFFQGNLLNLEDVEIMLPIVIDMGGEIWNCSKLCKYKIRRWNRDVEASAMAATTSLPFGVVLFLSGGKAQKTRMLLWILTFRGPWGHMDGEN